MYKDHECCERDTRGCTCILLAYEISGKGENPQEKEKSRNIEYNFFN